MRYCKLLLIQFLILMSGTALSQQKDPFELAAGGFRAADVKILVGLMKSSVDLEIPGQEGPLPKSEAGLALSKFFAVNKPKSVSVIHRINSNPKFRHGVLAYTAADKFRISLSMENVEGRFLIQGIRIEKE